MAERVAAEQVRYLGGNLGQDHSAEILKLLPIGMLCSQPLYLDEQDRLVQWVNASNHDDMHTPSGHFELFDGDPVHYTPSRQETD